MENGTDFDAENGFSRFYRLSDPPLWAGLKGVRLISPSECSS
jgi:hypothetical protein